MEINKVLALIKLGEKKYMQDLFEKGTVYLNPISYFRNIEKDELRWDEHEGIFILTQVQWLKIRRQSDGAEFEFSRNSEKANLVSAQLRESYPDFKGNLYCMYGISTEWSNQYDRIDPKNVGFGDSEPWMVVISNPTKFLDRVKTALQGRGSKVRHGGIVYYDPETYNGDLGAFYKPNVFEYQSEFRIFVENPNDEPICLDVGSLEDIAYFLKADNLADLRIKFEDILIQ